MLEPASWTSDTPRSLAQLFRAAFPEASYIGFGSQPVTSSSTHCCVQVAAVKFTGTIAVREITKMLPDLRKIARLSALEISVDWVNSEGNFLETRGHHVVTSFYDTDFDDYAKTWFPIAVQNLRKIYDARA